MKNKLFTEKKTIGFCLFLLLLAFSLPGVYAGGIEVDRVKGYVNNERVSDVDIYGGDFEVKFKDIIDLVITIDNMENTTTKIKLVGTIENIDDGDDIVKTQGWYDINANDDRSKTLSFSIPDDVRRDDYDFELRIHYQYSNGSEHELDRIDYSVIVETQTEEENINVYALVQNLTSSCESLAESTKTCFDYVSRSDNCSNELSTVKEERGTYKQQSEDCGGTRDTCLTDKAELEREKTGLDNQIKEMITQRQCNNQTAIVVSSVRKESDSKFNQTLGIGGMVALIYWYYNKKKKSKSTVDGSYYYEKK